MWEKRVAPLTGVAFAVLWLASSLLTADTFEFMPPASDIAEFLSSDAIRVMTGSYVGLLAAFALLWFSGSMYASIREIDGDTERLSFISGAGGVLAASTLAIGYLATLAAAERAWVHDSVDAGATAALADLTSLVVGNGATLGFAAMIAAASIPALRWSGAPRRIAIISLILALALISPYSWAVVALVLLWAPMAGIWIYRYNKTPEPLSVP
ncbi:MAG: hypothetical protein R3258_02305 [Acidimicrobiia bacterium]|nr:hypothetical protein [Acidimicrobiia bacterium]